MTKRQKRLDDDRHKGGRHSGKKKDAFGADAYDETFECKELTVKKRYDFERRFFRKTISIQSDASMRSNCVHNRFVKIQINRFFIEKIRKHSL